MSHDLPETAALEAYVQSGDNSYRRIAALETALETAHEKIALYEHTLNSILQTAADVL